MSELWYTTKKERKMSETYCQWCESGPPYDQPCPNSGTGGHLLRTRGSKTYRVRGPDGYVYRFVTPPPMGADEDWELVEVITH